MLQCVRVTVCSSVLQCVCAVCVCAVCVQCVAVRCSALQSVAGCLSVLHARYSSVLQCVAVVCCCVLLCVAVCCSVLQCAARYGLKMCLSSAGVRVLFMCVTQCNYKCNMPN